MGDETHSSIQAIMIPATKANLLDNVYMAAVYALSLSRYCEMNRVAVTPMPAEPITMNIPMVERTMPSSPNPSWPKILAQKMPANKIQNFPKAVPVSDQKAPLVILFAMSEAFNL